MKLINNTELYCQYSLQYKGICFGVFVLIMRTSTPKTIPLYCKLLYIGNEILLVLIQNFATYDEQLFLIDILFIFVGMIVLFRTLAISAC